MIEGCIYIVQDEPNICKIGFTTQDPPDKRIPQLSCKHHKDFIMKGCIWSENVKEDERIIHEFLKDYRIRGEWFRLSYEDIKEKSKEIGIYFDDYDRYIKVMRFIFRAAWHYDKKHKIWLTREQAGYDENGIKVRPSVFEKKRYYQ